MPKHSYSKSSSDLHRETDLDQPKRRTFLSAIFGHKRSRSADTRNREPTYLAPTYPFPPPAYEPPDFKSNDSSLLSKFPSINILGKPMRQESRDDALDILRMYDTVIVVDDSPSMTEEGGQKGVSRWSEARQALRTLVDVVAKLDDDGIDIHFLNAKIVLLNMKSAEEVRKGFKSVTPNGWTPTGTKLDELLRPYLIKLEAAEIKPNGKPVDRETGLDIKPVNFVVITDGKAGTILFDRLAKSLTSVVGDDPKAVIIAAAERLQRLRDQNLNLTQLGIQFVQVGNDPWATKALKDLDDGLHRDDKGKKIPDIVDTTPYASLNPVTADGLIKVLLGGILRKIDAQNDPRRPSKRS
ncbi:hypothetical protein DFH08DRAFT_804956 [Mycena albidolilacea]|uniref:VWFA domain-containing protein n=1 Tax=Mycena albidolilacea TaxID=1033008 RepID=A0AAD7EUZ3_9AGAR|nr:hypothetical protein DFH08DRAFT_804956 [Mycena albidolilacea]